jgi:hypothetical protein
MAALLTSPLPKAKLLSKVVNNCICSHNITWHHNTLSDENVNILWLVYLPFLNLSFMGTPKLVIVIH